MNAVRAPWASASFLLYTGGLTVLFASLWLLGVLSDDYSDGAFVGWSLLVFALLAFFAAGFGRNGRPLAAGLFAVSTVAAFAVFVGSLEQWLGWLPDGVGTFEGFHVGLLLLELLTLIASLVALSIFRFPLLVGVAAGVGWYFATDLISGGGNWSAIVTIAVGLLLLLVAIAVDAGESRPYGFWLHVVAGLTIGGGLLWFWHSSDTDWVLIAIASLLYILLGDRLTRSSWTVLGAIGLLWTTDHFVEKWAGSADFSPLFFFPFSLFPFSDTGFDEGGEHEWAGPIGYLVLGFVLVALGLLLAWRRRPLPPPPGPSEAR